GVVAQSSPRDIGEGRAAETRTDHGAGRRASARGATGDGGGRHGRAGYAVPAGRRGVHPESNRLDVAVAASHEYRVRESGADNRSAGIGRHLGTGEWVEAARRAGGVGRGGGGLGEVVDGV